MSGFSQTSDLRATSCNCIGPQNGDPLCPCMMRGVKIRDGRYILERDLGPVKPSANFNWFSTDGGNT